MALEEQWIKTGLLVVDLVRLSDIVCVYPGGRDGNMIMGQLRGGPAGNSVILADFNNAPEAEAFLVQLAERLGAKTLAEVDLTPESGEHGMKPATEDEVRERLSRW